MKYNRWGRNPNTDAAFAQEVRRHYAACVTFADAQVGRILARLDKHGLRDNTIVVLWGDHGWHLGEHAIWGKHALFEESLRSPLIISAPKMARSGKANDDIVETLDIFPTLAELANIPAPKFVHGESLKPLLDSPRPAPGNTALSYAGKAETIRTKTHRLIRHQDGHLELYDHRTREGETRNIAGDYPKLAQVLAKQLSARLALREKD